MSTEIEQRQAQVIEQLVKRASSLNNASSLASFIVEATSNPCLFAFSEILALPNLIQLGGTEDSAHVDLLRLFAYGTWHDYKSSPASLPPLVADQILKLKQLTVLTLAETNQVLSYDTLLEELEVSNVRDLEDFLINDCIYAGIVKGKLDQLQRCFEVQFALGRDRMPKQLGSMIETLSNWLTTSDNLLTLIQEKIEWADEQCQLNKNHQEEVKDKIEKAEKFLHFKKQYYNQSNLQEDVSDLPGSGGEMDFADVIGFKRRRHPHIHRQSGARD